MVACQHPKTETKSLNNKYATGFHYTQTQNEYVIDFQSIQDTIQVITQIKNPRIISLSNTIVPYLFELKQLSCLKAVSELSLIKNQKYQTVLQQNQCLDLASSNSVNLEKIIALNPDYVFVSCQYQYEIFQKLKHHHIKVICLDEFMEEHPLGVVEWIKCLGIILNQEKEASQIFEHKVASYEKTRDLVKHLSHSKAFIAGEDIQGQWLAPSNNSYIVQLMEDAGGDYVWKKTVTEQSRYLSWEYVLTTNTEDPYWRFLMFDCDSTTRERIAKINVRYLQLSAFQHHKIIYANGCRDDIFGEGVLEPDEQLKDIAYIFHPEAFKGHIPKYYHLLDE